VEVEEDVEEVSFEDYVEFEAASTVRCDDLYILFLSSSYFI